MPKRPAKLGNNFFGDSGTMLNENARDEIEKNAGAGHKGNSEAGNSEEPDEAESAARILHRMPEFRYAFFLNDPTEREKWVQRYREALNGQPNATTKKAEEQEEPSLSRAADDKFWSNPEEMKKAGKMVRPAKL